MKKVYKKRIVITGSSGLLGSYFIKKYKKKFQIINYPYKIQEIKLFKKWIINKKFDYFIHFAAITRNSKENKRKLFLINERSVKNILLTLNNYKKNYLKYFIFISSSHVYGNYTRKIMEKDKRKPNNDYGLSKKKIEDFILKERKKFYFKVGIARIFNFTGPKQRKGYFVPDIIQKIKKLKMITNINKYRDFIHIDDLMDSLILLINKKFEPPLNICSGIKINLITICKMINSKNAQREILYEKKRGGDMFGNNSLLRKLGKKNFKNIKSIINSYK